MGLKINDHKIVHEQHVHYLNESVGHAAWIRKREVAVDREMFDNEVGGFSDGFVDLILTLCKINAPGFAPMLGVGVAFKEVPGTEKVQGVVYYYNAFEIGNNLSSDEFAFDKYDEDEHIAKPPEWLGLPFQEEEDEDVEEEGLGEDADVDE